MITCAAGILHPELLANATCKVQVMPLTDFTADSKAVRLRVVEWWVLQAM